MVLLDSGSQANRLTDAERVKHWVATQSGSGNDTLADARASTRRG